MLKRFFLAFALTIGLAAPSFGAGTIPLSLTQRFDKTTFKPLSGGKLYFIQAGTTSTPQNAYQDSALTIPWPNPLTLDAGGNIPQLFFADGSIKFRLTNSTGVVQLAADGVLVVGPSGGGGGGSTVDATTILQTGDIKGRWGTGDHSGFVRANGRTIGSASSGATERANADCQALFEYLWNDPGMSVSTGRGASASADWTANKTITLPDLRSRAPAGMSDMGNSDNNLLSGVTFSYGNPTTLGASLGASRRSIAQVNLPNVTLTTNISDPGHSHANSITQAQFALSSGGVGPFLYGASIGGGAGSIITSNTTGITASTPLGGSGSAFDTISTYVLVTYYMKL